ncbi:hypothetical protein, partial [Neisseria meningitidis]|uniref:hypothetical protein n=1 Tax=Neisseria meningitidis TaxID=487 RepID=UPI0021A7E758
MTVNISNDRTTSQYRDCCRQTDYPFKGRKEGRKEISYLGLLLKKLNFKKCRLNPKRISDGILTLFNVFKKIYTTMFTSLPGT